MKKLFIVLFSFLIFFPLLNASELTDTLEIKITALVNAQRVLHGLLPLKESLALDKIARAHSLDMATRDFTGHVNPDGLDPTARAKKAGFKVTHKKGSITYTGVGENIFQMQSLNKSDGVITPFLADIDTIAKQAVVGWMKSPGHRKNILNPIYTTEGMGVAISEDKNIKVTQSFF